MAVFGMLMCFALVVKLAAAVDHTVGIPGGGWELGSKLDAWASSQTFRVGDNLVFQYALMHTVAEVQKADYDNCQTSNPIKIYTDGSTMIALTAPSKRYFICTTAGHCQGGMKLEVDTMATAPSPPPPKSPPPRPPPQSPSTPPPKSPPQSPSTPPPRPPPQSPSTPPPKSPTGPPPRSPSTPPPKSPTSPPPQSPSTPPPPKSPTSPPPQSPSTPPPESPASSSPPKSPPVAESPKSSAGRGSVFSMAGWFTIIITLLAI